MLCPKGKPNSVNFFASLAAKEQGANMLGPPQRRLESKWV